MLPRLLAILLLSATPALCADWSSYDDARYGYSIELPPEFALPPHVQSGSGLTLLPTDGSAKLVVFGTMALRGDFSATAKLHLTLSKNEGWKITYSKQSSHGVSFSGMRQDRIVYVRGIELCNGGAAFFQMDYAKADMHRYDAVVMRLVRSLHATDKCASSKQVLRGFPSTG